MSAKKPILHVVSVSGGKDSAATLDLALARCPRWQVVPIFCDTGNEDAAVYEYLDYLEAFYGIGIHRLKADFSDEIANKRRFIARDARHRREYDMAPAFDSAGAPIWKREPGSGAIVHKEVTRKGVATREPVQKMVKVGGGHRVRWTNKAKRRALAVLYPTGNPFLDLCMWKGRFPSRKGQFCTEHLKRNLAVAFQLELVGMGFRVISWQGVRRDESDARKNAKKFETIGAGIYAYRPIAYWTAADVFAHCAREGLRPNPLYLQGMDRVGCMLCINASKKEIRQTSIRFAHHIDRLAWWEILVGLCSKRGASSFMPAPLRGKKAPNKLKHAQDNDIYSIVRWSTTKRGGRELEPLTENDAPNMCSSSYGLCA